MILKRALLCGMLIWLSCCCYAKEAVISVILASDMSIYKDVSSGFNSFVTENGLSAHVSEHSLAGQEDKSVISAVSAENPDLIFVAGENSLKAAKQLPNSIPIVYSLVFDASQYANQNVSGIAMDIPVEMKISGIKKAFPNIKRLGMLYSPNSMAAYRDIAAECAKHGLALDAKEVNSEDEFSPALSAVLSDSDCFLVTLDTKVFFSQTIRLLFLESLKRKVPVIGLSSFFTKAGAAMSFDSDYKDVGRQSGEMASKVLAGEKISAIKPSHPRKYVYSLNLATAEKIGIVFPQNVVREAVEVFK